MVTKIERAVHQPFTRFAENVAIVSERVTEDPNVTIPRSSHELGLSTCI